QGHGGEFLGFESPENAFGLVTGIDHDRFARARVGQDRAVALERSDRERVDQRPGRHGWTATTVSTSCFSRASGFAQTVSGEARLSWTAHSWLSGLRYSDANSLRRLRGVKISQR